MNGKDEIEGIWWLNIIYIGNIMMKPVEIALSGILWGLLGGGADGGDNLTNVQCKPIWNCHNESPLYNE
jgi:hypothetical protein